MRWDNRRCAEKDREARSLRSDAVIAANRVTDKIEGVREKIYVRDLLGPVHTTNSGSAPTSETGILCALFSMRPLCAKKSPI